MRLAIARGTHFKRRFQTGEPFDKLRVVRCANAVANATGAHVERRPNAFGTCRFARMEGERNLKLAGAGKKLPVVFGREQGLCARKVECHDAPVFGKMRRGDIDGLGVGGFVAASAHATKDEVGGNGGVFEALECGAYRICLRHASLVVKLGRKAQLGIGNMLVCHVLENEAYGCLEAFGRLEKGAGQGKAFEEIIEAFAVRRNGEAARELGVGCGEVRALDCRQLTCDGGCDSSVQMGVQLDIFVCHG